MNQIQCNPFTERTDERAYHAAHGIVTESWAPLAAGRGLVEDPTVVAVADAHGVRPAQAVLAWHVQQGLVPIPKSANRERLAENLDVFGVGLSGDEIAALDALTNPDYRLTDADRFGH